MKIDQKKFRQTDEWKEFSIRIRNKYNNRCQICGSKNNVGVHHLNKEDYTNITNEDDYACLCFTCHKRMHGLNNKTQDYIENYLNKIKDIFERTREHHDKRND